MMARVPLGRPRGDLPTDHREPTGAANFSRLEAILPDELFWIKAEGAFVTILVRGSDNAGRPLSFFASRPAAELASFDPSDKGFAVIETLFLASGDRAASIKETQEYFAPERFASGAPPLPSADWMGRKVAIECGPN